jgi:hypothetical protein
VEELPNEDWFVWAANQQFDLFFFPLVWLNKTLTLCELFFQFLVGVQLNDIER